MKHVGIIAEYNPFHNGHAYQLQKIKEQFPEKQILVEMSGNYVQRGEPAIYNKYLRAECALACGADIVFELPCVFSISSAEYFATAAVLSLNATGMIDTLCFGAEDEDLNAMIQIARLLIDEPSDYKSMLKDNLKKGISYPKARSAAVSSYLNHAEYEALLKKPNNILGIEYIKTILKYELDITPVIIKRQGSDYNDTTLSHTMSSASALRSTIWNSKEISIFSKLKSFMPEVCYEILNDRSEARPLFWSDFYDYLQYALWKEASSIDRFFEMPIELANRISSIPNYPSDILEFFELLYSRNYTNTRIQRALLNLLLNNTKENMEQIKDFGYIRYLRILGFHEKSSILLREMKACCTVPVISKVAARNQLSSEHIPFFEKEICMNTLYYQAYLKKYKEKLPNEYQRSVIII